MNEGLSWEGGWAATLNARARTFTIRLSHAFCISTPVLHQSVLHLDTISLLSYPHPHVFMTRFDDDG